MKLYEEILFLKHHFKGKYCVENVQAYYKPLIEPQVVGRHWYWANFPINKIPVGSSGITTSTTSAGNPVKKFNVADWERLYGYDLSKYKITNKSLLLRNCVEPEVGLHILKESQKIYILPK